jgi:hypothetical protein
MSEILWIALAILKEILVIVFIKLILLKIIKINKNKNRSIFLINNNKQIIRVIKFTIKIV